MKFFYSLLLIFFGLQSISAAQSWVNPFKESLQLRQQGKYEEALSEAEKGLKLYLQTDGSISENHATLLSQLSALCFELSDYEKGQMYAQKEVDVRQSILDESTKLGTAYYNLGSFYAALNQHEKALESFNKALKVYENYYGPQEEDIIFTQWKLGSAALNNNQYDLAYDYFKKGFNNYVNEFITQEYLSASYDMAKACMAQEKYNEGIPYLLVLNDFYISQNDINNIVNLYVLLHLGQSYQALKEYTKALDYYNNCENLIAGSAAIELRESILRAKATCLQALGEDEEAAALYASGDINDPVALSNQAINEYNLGNLEKAKDLFNQSYAAALSEFKTKPQAYLEIATNYAGFSLDQQNLKEARKIITEALGQLVEDEELSTVAIGKLLLKKSQLLYKEGDYAESEQFLNRASEILNTSSNLSSSSYISFVNSSATLNYDLGRYDKAAQILEEAIANIDLTTLSWGEISSLYYNLAAIYQEQGSYSRALQLLDQMSGFLSQGGISTKDQQYLVEVLRQKTNIFLNIGDLVRAEENARRSIELLDEADIQNEKALVNLDVARILQAKGDYPASEKLYLASIEDIETNLGTNNPDYYNAVNNLGILYQTMGNYPEALRMFEMSGEGYEKLYGIYHPGYTTAIQNIATVYQTTGKVSEAEPLMRKVLESDRIIYGKKHPKYAVSLHNLATLFQKQGQLIQAEGLFMEALEIYKGSYGEYHPSYASTLYNLAVLNQEKGTLATAEDQFKKVIAIRKEILGETHPDYTYSLYGLASLYHAKGAYDQAQPYYRQAIDKYLYQINEFFPSLSEKEKSAFYTKIKPVFTSFVDFAYSYNRISGNTEILKDLYNVQLSTKAILLNAANKVRSRILSSGDQLLIDQYLKYLDYKEQVITLLSMSSDQVDDKAASIESLEIKLNELEKYLSERSAIFSSTYDQQTVTWKEVQKALGDSEAAIEIFRVSKRFVKDSVFYAALILKPDIDSPIPVIMKYGQDMEDRFYNYYRNSIKFDQVDGLSYKVYWQVIGEQLENINKLYVSADGVYNKISLSTLRQPETDIYLIDKFNIQLVSNTKDLLPKATSVLTGAPTALIFGSPDFDFQDDSNFIASNQNLTRMMGFGEGGITPLPGTKREADEVKQVLDKNGWNAQVYLEKNATEDNFKLSSSPKILHAATHGFFLSDLNEAELFNGVELSNSEANPLFRSGLLLAGASAGIDYENSTQDGILTAYEAMNLNLDNTDLVILSACETGLGEIRNGEGVYGLQRSFIVAGAESVLMSLWKVSDDATSELIISFYDNLLKGQDKFAAFRDAQLHLKKKYNSPYYWGAFIILGK